MRAFGDHESLGALEYLLCALNTNVLMKWQLSQTKLFTI